MEEEQATPYAVTLPSRSQFVNVRGLTYHIRRWGPACSDVNTSPLFLLHGWLDVSLSFQFLVDALGLDRPVLAPDWAGFGSSQARGGEYWFPDNLGDLEAVLDQMAPDKQVVLIGHSMGAQVASLYAGVRPARVSHLVCLDGLRLPDPGPDAQPERYQRWLDQLKSPPARKTYRDFSDLAARIRRRNARLDPARAGFIARAWGRERADGRIELSADPRHRIRTPVLYRADESIAVWRRVTAPVLSVEGGESPARELLDESEERRRMAAFCNLQRHTVAGAGHMVHHDRPGAVAARIKTFLDAS